VRLIVAAWSLGVLVILSACGGDTGGESDMDRRFRECTEMGGDFEVTDEFDGEYSCELPDPVPSPVPTESETP
jgi:hypothetical protein